MRIETKIDWLAFTNSKSIIPLHHSALSQDNPIAISGMRGYDFSLQYPDKRIVSTSIRQGCMVQFSGKALNECPIDHLELIRFYTSNGYKVSRIDLAIDCHDSRLSIDSLYNSIQKSEHETKSKNASIIDSVDGGKTLYVGSRQSEAFMRIYDKAVESGIEGDWKRIELELKGEKAIEASNQILSARDTNAYITGVIKGFCHFPANKTWLGIMKHEKILVKSDKQKSGDTRAWIMSQVSHSVAKLYLSGDTEIIKDMLEEVASIISNSRLK